MADFGLECTNDSGLVQIDSTNVNFEVIATGSVAGPASGYIFSNISFTACPNPPLLFMRTGTGYVSQVSWIKTGSNYTGAKLWIRGNHTVNWFVAAPQFSSSSDTWGLHIYNAAGAKVFDSGKPYLKIIDALRIGTANAWGGVGFSADANYSHVTTSQPYYCVGNNFVMVDSFAEDVADYAGCLAIKSNGTSSVNLTMWSMEYFASGGYNIYGSSTYLHTGADTIYQIPVIVAALGV